jgi:hypothetical protein
MSTLTTILVVAALWLLDYVGNSMPKTNHRLIVVRAPYSGQSIDNVVSFIRKSGVRVLRTGFQRSADLQSTDISVQVAYHNEGTFHNLQQQLADANEFELISINDS